jgi:flagellar FliL protein
MRLMIMAVLGLLLLGGGGAGAYFYFNQEQDPVAAQEAAAKKAEIKRSKTPSTFVELDPLILPIVDDNGVKQTVSMVIALEVFGNDSATKVEYMTPKLKDAYIQDMYGVLSKHAALKGGVIQVSMIKDRLNRVTAQVMGDDVVHDVLLQFVQQRPI